MNEKKIITTPAQPLAQYPWWELEYALYLTEWSGELFPNLIQGEELDHSNCSSYSILFWNNLIFSFSLIFGKFQIMSMTSFWCLYYQIRTYFTPFLVFTVDFEQYMLTEIELLMCNSSENCLKQTTAGPKQGIRFRWCPF